MKTELIKAVKNEKGKYRLIDEGGHYPQEGRTHTSVVSAYKDAALLWPHKGPWRGHKVRGGYLITIS